MTERQKILIVDDRKENLAALREVLGGVDAEIVEAVSGNQALAATLDHRFAVAILDVRMPGMNGYELAEHLRGDEKTKTIPLIFMTAADADDRYVSKGYEAGAIDYLVKPFAPEILLGKIRVFLELARDKRELQRHRDHLEMLVAERTAELASRTGQLQRLTVQLGEVEQHERRRLAQLLHDHLQQLLVASKFRIDMLCKRAQGEEFRTDMKEVNDLLDQAIASSKSLAVELCPPVLYDRGLGAALHWLGRWMEEKYKLIVAVEADEEAGPIAENVRAFAFQATRELLFNIVKHAQVQQAEVRMTAFGGRLQVAVSDHGVGFAPPGSSAPSLTSGFGLLNIRERLELMGGTLSIQSPQGQGTQITITVPTITVPLPPILPAPAERPADAPSPDPGRIRVLLADDHRIVRDGLASLLRIESDMDVVGAADDGQEAIEIARRLRPDIILMDVSMPRVNGIEATRAIMAELPRTRILGLSLHDSKDMADAMRQAGAAGYLVKECPGEELLKAIRALVSRPQATS